MSTQSELVDNIINKLLKELDKYEDLTGYLGDITSLVKLLGDLVEIKTQLMNFTSGKFKA
ncbi:MAG: hypothetical protein ACXAC7_04505 [Candidatus Hodarchaeales archaeon]|jgi:hypothetical protein